jgi:16S rRNA uridine-516 pseudouridylate synthase and related pseudouridylate synthases
LGKGIKLPDGVFKPENVKIEKINDLSCWLSLTLKEGKNRIIRRGFEAAGHRVAVLVRDAIGDLKLGNLKEGMWRNLSRKEVSQLLDNEANENR